MIYFIAELGFAGEVTGLVKVGFTSAESANSRCRGCSTGNPRDLVVLKTINGTVEQERALHRELDAWRIRGEWFAFSPHAINVLHWKRVRSPETFLRALGNGPSGPASYCSTRVARTRMEFHAREDRRQVEARLP